MRNGEKAAFCVFLRLLAAFIVAKSSPADKVVQNYLTSVSADLRRSPDSDCTVSRYWPNDTDQATDKD
ncbi:hypothetical protein [Oceanisphaera sp. W20_SRM_FM3]|uniref:hypothetical protein n=1 Tax=Oceanisphaera sp. W20_SRM_FM3 TaxID=3240267 RepID=UPI003F99F6E2